MERPDLDGIVAYAKEGFGPFVGFVSGWGYWLSIWIGNVAFGVMLATAIGYFFPPFSEGLTVGAVIFISVVNWLIVLLVNRGVEEASVVKRHRDGLQACPHLCVYRRDDPRLQLRCLHG